MRDSAVLPFTDQVYSLPWMVISSYGVRLGRWQGRFEFCAAADSATPSGQGNWPQRLASIAENRCHDTLMRSSGFPSSPDLTA